MKFVDCHMHMMGKRITLEHFLKRLDKAGTSAAVVLSYPPASYKDPGEGPETPAGRLELVMDWAKRSERVYPFFWIDPLEESAFEQVDAAAAAGIAGFKVICDRHYPCDERPMRVWEKIAQAGKPILFHSGILYSPRPASIYNRPVGFEPLFEIPNLRFALAHVSWPWHDENLALFGHWCDLKSRGLTSAEMFIDTTPGTPAIYREEVLGKIYRIGYPVEDNVMLGIDCMGDYDADYASGIVARDEAIFNKLGIGEKERKKYFRKNALRFIGK